MYDHRCDDVWVGIMRWALWLFLCGIGVAEAEGKRPNILFLFADDQSYKTVSCYPEALPGVKTPNLDALAERGLRFDFAYMGSWCMASRASILTGRHPYGIESMRMEGAYPGSAYDPDKCPFWPKVFRQQGYQTVQFGKWHTGTDSGWGRDWDHQIVWNRPLNPENAGAYFYDQILYEDGVRRLEAGYSTDVYTDWTCDFIKGRKRDPEKPWMLWLCWGAIHGPTTPAKRHIGKHAGDEIRYPADLLGPRPGKPEYLEQTQAWVRGEDGKVYAKRGKGAEDAQGVANKKASAAKSRGVSYDQWVRQSNECVEALDEGVGRIVEALRVSGQLENTLIVYSADQGFGMGEHGFKSKLGPWDATYRSPMIVAMPSRFAQGAVVKQPVNAPDLVSTFFAVAGIEEPWEMHGRDFSALLVKPETTALQPCLYSHTGKEFGHDVTRTLREDPVKAEHNSVPYYLALNDGTWKYIRYLRKGETEELYDLQADPEELHNLADEPKQSSRLQRMRELMIAEAKRTRAEFADAIPASKQMRQE